MPESGTPGNQIIDKSKKVRKKQYRQSDNHGKIFFYNGFLFISKQEMGIYIFDNAEPSPARIGFIELVKNVESGCVSTDCRRGGVSVRIFFV